MMMRGVFVLMAFCWACACLADAPVRLADGLCALRFEKGALVVSDAAGRDAMRLGKIRFVWNPANAVPVSATLKDGKIDITYTFEHAGTNELTMAGTASLTGHGFRIDLTATIPPNVKSGGQLMEIVRTKGTRKDWRAVKCGYWKRCKPAVWKKFYRAGVPFEVASCTLKKYITPTQTFWFVNPGWSGERTEFAHFPKGAGKDRVFHGYVEFVTGVDAENAELAAAEKDGRPFVMAFKTEKPFNIFDAGAPSATLTVRPIVSGRRTLRVTARDFDGNVVLDETREMAFERGKPVTLPWTLPAFAGGRGIYFLEASILNGETEDCFTRTSVAGLPPHTFRHRDTSIAAMAAYPATKEAYRLMERLGVAIVRYGDNHFFTTNYNITAYRAVHAPNYVFNPTNAKHLAHLEKDIIAPLKRDGNPYLEFGNEVGWKKSAAERKRLVACYASWVEAIVRRLKEEKLDVKLITFGLQPDYTAAMMEDLKAAGVFDKMTGLTLHPGRGYYTADNTHGGWVYRGIIQRARRKFDAMGFSDKEIHMTECYASTHPNDGWKDSYRQATENTLLNLVIAAAEPRVKTMMFYKLHQGLSSDPHGYPWAAANGITTVNSEYDYGLLMRDDSPKPSLLAYAAACEQLDGATFRRELPIPKGGPTLRALEFATPRGSMAVLFDRSESGNYHYLWRMRCPRGVPKGLNLYRHLEAWERHWRKRVKHTFRTTAKEVTVYDVIGRKRTIPADENGTVTLELDGEPVMAYGLNLNDKFAAAGGAKGGEDATKDSLEDYDYAAEEKSAAMD